ncbi:MAG: DUF4034 domain-containing protein [Elusimicrobia bacterium]|nr:DUF4034 domain-containing protein [Elusimicrobiota bacterium]
MLSAAVKKILLSAVVAGGGYFFIPARYFWKIGIHVPYPIEEFGVDAADGFRLTNYDCLGRPILLATWGAWCPHMPGNLATIERLKARFSYSDICIVPVSNDPDPANAWEFARSHQMAEPNYWGYKGLSAMYWGYATPHFFLFDRKGRLRLNADITETTPEALMAAVVNVIEDGAPRNTTPSPTRPGQARAVDDEVREAQELAAENARLFKAGRLDELDARAATWRKGRERTLLDVWKEETIYTAIVVSWQGTASDADYEARLRLFENWVSSRPASVTARMALGQQWFQYAWKARGQNWENDVIPQARRHFEERLEKSRILFEETALMPDTTPVVYRELLYLARSQEWNGAKTDELLKRSLAFEPDYWGYYETRAESLLPRWGGSDESVVRFAAASADSRKDGRGDELYASILWNSRWAYADAKRSPFDAGFSWPRARAGCAAVLSRRPGSTAWANRCAKLAVLAGDKETARGMFTTLAGRFDDGVWTNYLEYWQARVGASK